MQQLLTPSRPSAPTSTPLRSERMLPVVLATLLASFSTAPAVAQGAAVRAAEHRRLSEAATEVAQRYFAAYIARDWSTLEPLLDDGASFEDPTASRVFGAQRHVGKAAVMKLFREGYAGITDMSFQATRVMSSVPYTVFSGELRWTLRLSDGRSVSSVMPIVSTVRVNQGRVIAHVDLADYQPFLDALAHAAPPSTR